jgi:hypothetical protein
MNLQVHKRGGDFLLAERLLASQARLCFMKLQMSTGSRRFASREIARGVHWIGDWVGPKVGLELLAKTKYPYYHLK